MNEWKRDMLDEEAKIELQGEYLGRARGIILLMMKLVNNNQVISRKYHVSKMEQNGSPIAIVAKINKMMGVDKHTPEQGM